MTIAATAWAMRVQLPKGERTPLLRLTLILAAEDVQDCGDGFLDAPTIAAVSGRLAEDVLDDFSELESYGLAGRRKCEAPGDREIIVFGMPDRQMKHDSCPVTAGGRRGPR